MFSSPMMVAVASLLVAPAPSTSGGWQPDYGTALTAAATKHRPVAVVIGSGDAAQGVPAEVASALKASFECLYIDAASPAGAGLASQFRMTQGLVISDADGKVQALRHEGSISPADAATYAERFAQATGVARTEYVQMMMRPAMSAPAMMAPPAVMAAPSYQPAPAVTASPSYGYQPAPVYAPNYAPSYPAVRSGGCAGGSCGRVSYPAVTYSSGGCASGRCGR